LFEDETEGLIISISTVESQLLGSEVVLGGDSLMIEAYEVIDAKIVDISIVSETLAGEILTEVETVGANSLGKLDNGHVVL
jgi:hypothetical protein